MRGTRQEQNPRPTVLCSNGLFWERGRRPPAGTIINSGDCGYGAQTPVPSGHPL